MNWFGRRDSDFQDEIRTHLDLETEENLQRGVAPEEARLAALRKFGSVSAARERTRQARPLYWLETTWQDARYAVRSLFRTPLLTAAVLLTLTLGIGLTTAVYTLINAIAFRARVDKDPATYVRAWPEYLLDGKKQPAAFQFTFPDWMALSAYAQSLTEIAAWKVVDLALPNGDRAGAALVTQEFFTLYGLSRPRLGRLFRPDEYTTEPAVPVAVISEEFWRDHLGADPAAIGRTIRLNQRAVMVVGVAPARFSGRIGNTDAWLPLLAQPLIGYGDNLLRKPDEHWLSVGGRLKPGHSHRQVQAELATIYARLDKQYPGRKTHIAVSDGSWSQNPGARRHAVWIIPLILTALHLVLLIACANVTSLMLSRAAARQREIAIRLSIGAGRWRLLRMMLTESILLSLTAGAISVWLANVLPEPLFKKITHGYLPSFSLAPDANVLVYLGFICTLAGVLAGIAPALESLKAEPAASLKGLGSIFGGSSPRSRSRHILVAAQVALSMVLLTSVGLFLVTYIRIFAQTPVLDTNHVLFTMLRYDAAAPYREIARAVESIPGVDAFAFTDAIPFQNQSNTLIHAQEQPHEAMHAAQSVAVSPGYFQVLKVSPVGGRDFREDDSRITTGMLPVVVSEQFARAFWPSQDAIGKRFESSEQIGFQIIGIVSDSTLPQFGKPEAPVFYRLWNASSQTVFLAARFSGDVAGTTTAVRNAIQNLSTNHLAPVRTLQALLDELADAFWMMVQLVGMLGGIAIGLAMIGIYGVVAFSTAQRTKEIGIRMAIGASRANIIVQVLRSGRPAIVTGLVAGLVLSAGAAIFLQKALQNAVFAFDIRDPIPYLAVSFLLIVMSILAMLEPALRASRTDPLIALRQE